jgi:hypothetical protein
MPGGQSATFGSVSVITETAGHSALLDADGAGFLHAYAFSAKATLLSTTLAGGSCAWNCSEVDGECWCGLDLVFVAFCRLLFGSGFGPDGLAGGASVAITDLDFSSVIDFGLGALNPTFHITGDINLPLPCPADINDDTNVNVTDLLAVIGAWGACSDPDNCPADVNNDDTVNVTDLLAVIGAWGPCP